MLMTALCAQICLGFISGMQANTSPGQEHTVGLMLLSSRAKRGANGGKEAVVATDSLRQSVPWT